MCSSDLSINKLISPYWLVLPALIACITLWVVAAALGLATSFATPISSFVHEWWARMGGITMFMTGSWLLVFVFMLYLPLRLVSWLSSQFFESLSLLGVITTAAVYLGKSGATNGLETFKIN